VSISVPSESKRIPEIERSGIVSCRLRRERREMREEEGRRKREREREREKGVRITPTTPRTWEVEATTTTTTTTGSTRRVSEARKREKDPSGRVLFSKKND